MVVGPERLPGLIKDVMRWTRATQRFITNTKHEIERELDYDVGKDLNTRIEELDDLMDIAPDRQEDTQPTEPSPRKQSEPL